MATWKSFLAEDEKMVELGTTNYRNWGPYLDLETLGGTLERVRVTVYWDNTGREHMTPKLVFAECNDVTTDWLPFTSGVPYEYIYTTPVVFPATCSWSYMIRYIQEYIPSMLVDIEGYGTGPFWEVPPSLFWTSFIGTTEVTP